MLNEVNVIHMVMYQIIKKLAATLRAAFYSALFNHLF